MGCLNGKQKEIQLDALPDDPRAPINKAQGADAVQEAGSSEIVVGNKGRVQDFYDQHEKLGEGGFGSVCAATKKGDPNGKKLAIKTMIIAKQKNLERLSREIAIMKKIDHPNIIKLYDSFKDAKCLYLVMEVCLGGELFDRIVDAGKFTENIAAKTMQQVFKAMLYMHDNGITHRDLKPENFIYETKDPIDKATLKIIDFGLSCTFKKGQVLTTQAGTPFYVAPQVLEGKYDQQADMWSCGVIMFVLLCGYPPFAGRTDQDVLAKVRAGVFKFKDEDWKNVSEDAKVLIRGLLTMDPKQRVTSKQAVNHTWVKNSAPKANDVDLSASIAGNLRRFMNLNKFQKAALHVIASQMDDEQMKALKEAFASLDRNGDGFLTLVEMNEGMNKAGMKEIPPELKAILDEVDADGSGAIDYTEFMAATMDKKLYAQEAALWDAFKHFDKNSDGKICVNEMRKALEEKSLADPTGALKEAEAMLAETDGDGDGNIDFDEFLVMMRGRPKPKPSGETKDGKQKTKAMETGNSVTGDSKSEKTKKPPQPKPGAKATPSNSKNTPTSKASAKSKTKAKAAPKKTKSSEQLNKE